MKTLRYALVLAFVFWTSAGDAALVFCGIQDNQPGDLLPQVGQVGVRNCALGGGFVTGTAADASTILGGDNGGILFMASFTGNSGAPVVMASSSKNFAGGAYNATVTFSGTLLGNQKPAGNETFSLSGSADNPTTIPLDLGPVAAAWNVNAQNPLPQAVAGKKQIAGNLPKGVANYSATVDFNVGNGTSFRFGPPALGLATAQLTSDCPDLADLICDINQVPTQYVSSFGIAPVPEPDTALLVAIGLCIMALVARREFHFGLRAG